MLCIVCHADNFSVAVVIVFVQLPAHVFVDARCLLFAGTNIKCSIRLIAINGSLSLGSQFFCGCELTLRCGGGGGCCCGFDPLGQIGDMVVLHSVAQVAASKVFRRDGADLHSDVVISLSQAVLGGNIRVPGIHGDIMLSVSYRVCSLFLMLHCPTDGLDGYLTYIDMPLPVTMTDGNDSAVCWLPSNKPVGHHQDVMIDYCV